MRVMMKSGDAMSEVGTLKELGVKVGDVVGLIHTGRNSDNFGKVERGLTGTIGKDKHVYIACHGSFTYDYDAKFKMVSRAVKLWRDLTPAEKGALLLAHHENPGSVEFLNEDEWVTLEYLGWLDNFAYRIKPEPVVETVTVYGGNTKAMNRNWGFSGDHLGPETHRITFQTINGKPDCASVKMEEVS